MSSRRTVFTAARLAVAVAAIGVASLAAAAPASADATEPPAVTVTVTPATDLVDGQVVDVAAGGFAANEGIVVAQCAQLAEGSACNQADRLVAFTDENGAAAVQVTVRVSFEGVDPATGDPVGPVDCAVVVGGCAVGAADFALTNIGFAPIAFA